MLLWQFITVTDRRDNFVLTVLTLSSPTSGRQHDDVTTQREQHQPIFRATSLRHLLVPDELRPWTLRHCDIIVIVFKTAVAQKLCGGFC